MNNNDYIVLKYEEMQILSAIAGITEYYGMDIPDEEITKKETFYELLFRMVKKKLLKAEDKVYLEEPLRSIFEMIEKAGDIFVVYPTDDGYPTTCYYCGNEIVKVQNGSKCSKELKIAFISRSQMQEELLGMQGDFYQDEDEENEIYTSEFDGDWEDGAVVIAQENCLFLLDHIKNNPNKICSRLIVERQGLFEWIIYQEEIKESMLYEEQRFMEYIHRMIGGCP